MSEFFLGSKAQACSLPLGSCIRAMQTFGRKWTNCNLVCGRPFRRKSSRFESDDVQILCLICLDFQRFRKIASVPQPIVCTEPIRFGCLFVLTSPAPKVLVVSHLFELHSPSKLRGSYSFHEIQASQFCLWKSATAHFLTR